jgi:predicted MFS family arabinose efflux permease
LGAISFLLLPIFNQGFFLLMVGFLLARFCFEFTIVSNLALLSEQMPSQRGKLLTFGAAFGLIGTSLAGFTGPAAYAAFGPWGVGAVSAAAMTGAFLLNCFIVREP